MKPTISDGKRTVLNGLLKDLENEFSAFLHRIELDTTVPNTAWDTIDQESSSVYSIITQLKDEIIFG